MQPIRSYKPSTIEALALNFLSKHWLPSKIWVDIEYIIEKDLGVAIDYTFLDSGRVIGLIGIRKDGTYVIVVEEELANQSPVHYRSTLAQEVGHLVLHKDLLERAKTPEDALQLHKILADTEYALIEAEANAFALAVLMPSKEFKQACMEMYADWFTQIKREIGSMSPDFLHGKLVEELARRFQVSNKAARLRLEKLELSKAILDAAYKGKSALQL